jgi:L-fucose mutarotase
MIKGKLIHPEILGTLAACGHFSRIMIADGNFPVATMTNPGARRVFLNLMPGVPTVTQVLEAILSVTVVQAACVVAPPEDAFRAVHKEYRELLPADIAWEEKERWAFYGEVKSPDTGLVIATGDVRRFANLLLTVGVVRCS